MKEYLYFKRVLEYFVAHLEWLVNKDSNRVGYSQYILPVIEKGIFRQTGQGYAGDRIQNQIQEWSHYPHGEICINIQSNFGDYTTSKCYLNWKSTGLNIIARWDNNDVISLRQEEYCYWEDIPSRIPIGQEKSIESLGLFNDAVQVTEDLKEFFERFQNEIIRYNKLEIDKKHMENIMPYIELLKYKKQIILQGPPGTGKTKLAKEIVGKLVSDNLKTTVTFDDIENVLTVGKVLLTPTNYNSFSIVKVEKDKVTVYPKEAKNEYSVSFSDIVRCAAEYQAHDQVSKFNTSGIGSYLVAIANHVVDELAKKQFKIVQFHPSFSYEDFVRGIIAESKGDKIEYRSVNKILGKLADDATKNLLLSEDNNITTQQNLWVDLKFEDFKEELDIEVEQQQVLLSGNIGIFSVETDCFRYGKDWGMPSRINFIDFKNLIKAILNHKVKLTDSKISKEISVHAHYRYTYYLPLVRLFFEKYKFTPLEEKTFLKNYVLVIDEINRANLSSVLGELIYALEYRNEIVEGMYGIDGKNDFVLPPNLYIIGTMNTADRSVGHIDYAIRRRFAFVDVMPIPLKSDNNMNFDDDLFEQVTRLFTIDNYQNRSSFLSSEFDPQDVALGHSYFIQKLKKTDNGIIKIPGDMNVRLKYEIIPILKEYVKDGVLKESALAEIEKLKVSI